MDKTCWEISCPNCGGPIIEGGRCQTCSKPKPKG